MRLSPFRPLNLPLARARLVCAFVLLASLVLGAGQAGAPDPASLDCRIVKDVSERSGLRRLWVEVSNPGDAPVEPLEFRIEHRAKGGRRAKGKPPPQVRVDRSPRAAFPLASRHGRPVPPKGKQRYWLACSASAADEETWVGVAQACAASGDAIDAPALVVGKIGSVDQKSFDGTPLAIARVAIQNPLTQTVDAIFLATTTAPRDEQVLLGVRLAPGANDWVISEITGRISFEQSAPVQAVRVQRLELVDWCAVGATDPNAAAALLETPYRKWIAWTAPFPAIRGRIQGSVQSNEGQGVPLSDRQFEGRFTIDAQGRADVVIDGVSSSGADMSKLAARTVQRAFADLRRDSFEELVASHRLAIVGTNSVEVDGPSFAGEDTALDFASRAKNDPDQTLNLSIENGRIVGHGDRGSFRRYVWTTRDFADGYVVSDRRTPAGDWCYQHAYEVLGAWVVPSGYRESWSTFAGDVLQQTQIRLFDQQVDGSGAPVVAAPPAGEGVAALRAAWNNGYRYPSTPRELRARFEVRTPGTDWVWQGHRELDGRLVLGGFAGFLMEKPNWAGYRAEFDAKLPGGQQSALGFVFYDRLVLWCGRDFNGRADFDVQFAGCSIGPAGRDGVHEIEGGPIDRATVREDRVVALRWRSGMERRFTWTNVGDQRVVSKVVTGREELTVERFQSLDGWILPVEFEFRRVFGDDWGPERIRLTAPELR